MFIPQRMNTCTIFLNNPLQLLLAHRRPHLRFTTHHIPTEIRTTFTHHQITEENKRNERQSER